MMRHAILLATGLVVAVAAVAAQQQPPVRDPQRDPQAREAQSAPKGTGIIAGSVVTEENTPQPVRGARVQLTSPDMPVSRTVYTDDAGKFRIADLPTSRFTLSATKPGWVRTAYGAKRPDRPGTPITLADGQQMTDVALRMARGGVIAGTITDENGQPAFGAQVRVLQYRMVQGERTLGPVVGGAPFSETTDDRGQYRLFGLAAGEYVIAASPRTVLAGDVRAMTDGEIRAALQALQQPPQAQQPGTGPTGTPPPAREEGTTVAYAPVYYPGTTASTNAMTVTLGPGEERSGVDFPLQLVRTAKVEGTVATPAGIPVQSVQLMMVPIGSSANPGIGVSLFSRPTVNPDGKFSYGSVTPGRYLLTARASRPREGAAPAQSAGSTRFTTSFGSGEQFTMIDGGGGSQYWAQVEVSVDGQPVTDVALTLQPGMKVGGKIEFRGTRAIPPADLTRVRLNLLPAPTGGGPNIMVGMPAVQIEPDGRFTFDGVTPGRYRLNATVPVAPGSGPGAGWTLKSAVVNGKDALDFPLEVRPNEQISDAVVTFTDATQEVSGTLQDAAGRPAPDFTIVVFPADKALWTASRRIVTSRPGTDGKFTVARLPVGNYRIAALVDIAPGEANDPAFLEQLVAASVPFSLAEGEKKVQDLRIAR